MRAAFDTILRTKKKDVLISTVANDILFEFRHSIGIHHLVNCFPIFWELECLVRQVVSAVQLRHRLRPFEDACKSAVAEATVLFEQTKFVERLYVVLNSNQLYSNYVKSM